MHPINQLDVVDIYGILYPETKEYIFFSSIYRTFIKKDYMLINKINCNKVQKTEIIQSIFSNHKSNKLETNNKMHVDHP